MSADFDALANMIQEYIDEQQEFLSFLGTTVEDIGEGELSMSVPYDQKLTNVRRDSDSRPDIHGGVAATLIDTTGGLALRTVADNPLRQDAATVNLNVNYLRPATGDLTAHAAVIRHGSTIGVSQVDVESTTPDGETKVVATGQADYRIFGSE